MFWARSEHGQTLVDNLRIGFSILRISALWHCSFSERLLQNNRQVSFDSNFFNPLSDCLRILFEMRMLVCLATKLVTTQNHNSCLLWHGWSVMLFCSFLSSLSCLKVSQKARVPHPFYLFVYTDFSFLSVKPGVCPRRRLGYGRCAEFCSKDSDCPDKEKCCSNGCGHECMAPYVGERSTK